MSETPTQDLRVKAEEMIAARVDLVTELGAAAEDVAREREALRAAERRENEAWTAATAGGWSKRELQQLGFSAPGGRRGGRGGAGGGGRRKTPAAAPRRPSGGSPNGTPAAVTSDPDSPRE